MDFGAASIDLALNLLKKRISLGIKDFGFGLYLEVFGYYGLILNQYSKNPLNDNEPYLYASCWSNLTMSFLQQIFLHQSMVAVSRLGI